MTTLIDNLKSLIVPQGKIFFTLLSSVAENNCKMSELLIEVCRLSNREERIGPAMIIEKLEGENDETTHEIFTDLGKVFLTPIPREDIHTLAGSLDDVADYIYSISRHMYLISPGLNDEIIIGFANIINESTSLISEMIHHMALRNPLLITNSINSIKKLTAKSSDLYEQSLETLYKTENDFKLFIRLREVFMVMNETMIKCQNVAKTIENIGLSNID